MPGRTLTVEMVLYLDSLVNEPMEIMQYEFMDEFSVNESDATRLIADWTTHGICPVCEGTKVVPLTEEEKKYSWNKDVVIQDCRNCGGQYQFGRPTGIVHNNGRAKPCTHNYRNIYSTNRGINRYQCLECGDQYTIDSGD